MYSGKLVFAQLMDHLPLHTFRRCVAKYPSRYPTLTFSHLDQCLCMAFAQWTFRESLRDIETCLRAHATQLYPLGIRGGIARSTLADANETRDWRIDQDFALSLIPTARKLYAQDRLGVALMPTVYALDSTPIDLGLALFPGARCRPTQGAVKLPTLLDLRGSIPSVIHLSDGKLHDVNSLDQIAVEAGSFYLMDRGSIDFGRLHGLPPAQAVFVIRAQSNLPFQRVYSHPLDKDTGLRCDQTIRLTGTRSRGDYPTPLRRVKFSDARHDQRLVFLTNHVDLPALTLAALSRSRWQVALFFKWIKQHLRIKAFFGTSENAVKTQVWIAIAVSVLVAIVKKRLGSEASLYPILQILSLSLFEKTPIDQLVANADNESGEIDMPKQLDLFT
jgi:hypothetical protein